MSNQQQSNSTSTSSPQAIIRSAEPEDYVAIKSIYEQPGAYYGTLQMPYPSAQEWKKRLEFTSSRSHNLVACIEDVPVGNIGLSQDGNPRRRHTGHIGMGVHDAYVGKGLGQLMMEAVIEIADNWLNLTRLELSVYTDNQRAIALYERTGFEQEGVLRQYAFRDGDYVDALAMARLRK